MNDVAIIGGLVGFYDLIRRSIADRVDKVVTEHVQRSPGRHPKIKAVTRVIQATPMIDPARIMQRRLDQFESQIATLRAEIREDVESQFVRLRREFRTGSLMAFSTAVTALLLTAVLAVIVLSIVMPNGQLTHLLKQGMHRTGTVQFSLTRPCPGSGASMS